MNKKVAAYCQALGLTVNKNIAEGIVKGYETRLFWNILDIYFPLKIHISAHADEKQQAAILARISQLQIPQSKAEFTPFGLLLGFNDALTVKRLMARLPAEVDAIYTIITQEGALGSQFCPMCGELMEAKENKSFHIGDLNVTLHCACVDGLNEKIESENAAFEEVAPNRLRGFLGALTGAVIGAALAVGLYLLGYISALSAIVAIFAGAFFYRKFGGKPDKVMVITVSVTSLVLIELAIFIIYVVAAGIAAEEASAHMDAIDAFWFIMSDAEIAGMIIKDLALTFVFTLIGTLIQAFGLAKAVRRDKTIK